MKVKKLMDELSKYNPESEVRIASNNRVVTEVWETNSVGSFAVKVLDEPIVVLEDVVLRDLPSLSN